MTLSPFDEFDPDDYDPEVLGAFLMLDDPDLIADLAEEYGMDPDASALVRLAQAMACEDGECR